MSKYFHKLFLSLLLLFSQEIFSQIRDLGDCRGVSAFIRNQGLDPKNGAFSTSEKSISGLVYLQYDAQSKKTIGYIQHPTWKRGGRLGPIVIDKFGNVYVAPVPFINVLENKQNRQNILYKVDSNKGTMDSIIDLPSGASQNETNPFGLVGMAYDCETGLLFASSLMGSDRNHSNGIIYSISVENNTYSIIDTLNGLDGFGIGIAYKNNQKRLFIGDPRNGNINSVEIKPNGQFSRTFQYECTLEDLGLRGDDRPRKIRFSPNGDMIVYGIEFHFNLIGPQEKQESKYTFRYDAAGKKWLNIGVN